MVKTAKSQKTATGTTTVTARPVEVIIVDNDANEVKCDGGLGALGHPAVWYSFDKSDDRNCGYCGRVFVKQRSAKAFK